MTRDLGLACLTFIVQYHRRAVDPQQLAHLFKDPDRPCDLLDLRRIAKSQGFTSRKSQLNPSQLKNELLPAIALTHDGQFVVLLRVAVEGDTKRFLIKSPVQSNAITLNEFEFAERLTGTYLLIKPEGRRDEQSRFSIRWFIPSLIKYRRLFAEVVLISFFLQLFALVTPLFFQLVMDKVLVHRGFTTLDVLAIGFFAIALFDALLGTLRNYLFSHTANRVDVELGARLFQHLMALPLRYFEMRQVGQSVARVRELETIRNFITGSALTLLIDLSFTLIFFAVMWIYSPTLTWIVLATIPCYVLLSVLITPVLRSRLDKSFQYGAANQAFLVESITGVETVKSMALEPQMQRKWEGQLADYVQSSFKAQNLNNIASQIASFISKVTTLLIIWFGAHLVIDGAMTVGELVAFNMIAGRVSAPILKLVQLWQDFQQAGISIKRLGDLLNTQTETYYNPTRSVLPKLKGAVRFENLCFRYHPESAKTLDEINLDIRPGELIGIVGRSGSGKSTLTKLIQRIYQPENGRVLIDGVDLSLVDTSWLRRNIGVVLQDSFLFNASIRENIAIRNPGLPLDRVMTAAKLAGAHAFISEFPEGYDHSVGEQGANLSGGQRQRIAIARALINDPKILVFDEATSALDYESERRIQQNMAAITRDRTVFVIAHRLSAVRRCDRIIVMESGRIIESGTHQELLEQQGQYQRLWMIQNGELQDASLEDFEFGTI